MGSASARLQQAAGRLVLANKAYMSIRPDGVVIDRSVGQYCNSRLLHDTYDTRSWYDLLGESLRAVSSLTQRTQRKQRGMFIV